MPGPLKSLLALRCATCPFKPLRSRLTPSKDGVCPRYQAVGDEGDIADVNPVVFVGNIGFGLCIGEPSDPVLRLARDIPYPVFPTLVAMGRISPNRGLRCGADRVRVRSTRDWKPGPSRSKERCERCPPDRSTAAVDFGVAEFPDLVKFVGLAVLDVARELDAEDNGGIPSVGTSNLATRSLKDDLRALGLAESEGVDFVAAVLRYCGSDLSFVGTNDRFDFLKEPIVASAKGSLYCL